MRTFVGMLIVPPSKLTKEFGLRERSRLTWTTDHPASSYGLGVLTYRNDQLLDGFIFRRLRDALGATVVTKEPHMVCQALGVPVSEPGILTQIS